MQTPYQLSAVLTHYYLTVITQLFFYSPNRIYSNIYHHKHIRKTQNDKPRLKLNPPVLTASPVRVKMPTSKLMLRPASSVISMPSPVHFFSSLLERMDAQMPVPRISR